MNGTMTATPKPKWTEASMFKLYVSPVNTFDKTSLWEMFSQYAEVVDVYISEPNDVGFKWAFVYFATDQGLEETVAKIFQNNEYNFKLSRAKPKINPLMAPVPAIGESFGAKMINGITKTNGVPYTAPPNCVNCRKLTFSICVSCKNPFCSKECTLDGWRSHTGLCVRIAELVRIPEATNGVGNALAPTVVNFMKGCQYTKKKFTSDEFADACNYRSKINIASQTAPKEEDEYDGASVPNQQPPTQEKGKRMAASLPKPPPLVSDDKENPWNPTEEKQQTKPFVKHKRNSVPARKPNRKCVTDNEDTEGNSRGKMQYQRKPHDSDTEGEGSVVGSVVARSLNGYRTDEKRIDFKKKFTNESKRPVVSKDSKVAPVARAPVETDLNLRPRDSLTVVVTSIVNTNTFYVANANNVTNVLREILDCAERAPLLQNVEINSLCLASFDGDWYRAKILSTSPIEVEYIDYGNREQCQIENLKVLPHSLEKYLPLATKVQLKEGFVQVYNIKENEEIEIFVHHYDTPNRVWIVDVL